MPNHLLPRVRQRRQEQGLTIENLAFRAGVSVSTVNRVERGSHSPSIATLSAIAGALDTTVVDLVAEDVAEAAAS